MICSEGLCIGADEEAVRQMHLGYRHDGFFPLWLPAWPGSLQSL